MVIIFGNDEDLIGFDELALKVTAELNRSNMNELPSVY